MTNQENKSLSVNGIYDRCGNGSNIRVYFRKIDLRCISGSFTIAKPIAIKIGNHIEDDFECLDFTFVLKDHMVKAINLADYQYWMLEIKSETTEFVDKDGTSHTYHPSTISYVRHPKAIQQLEQYGMRADRLFEYNEDYI